MENETILRFDNVSFKFNSDKIILDQVDFSVRRGKKITIMGQNGAGKSTILKLITGEIKPDDVILEIGPGKGALTEKLLACSCQLIAVEKDRDLYELLKDKFQALKTKLKS